MDELCFIGNGGTDGVQIERTVLQQIHLAVCHAVFHQRAGGGADADDLFQCVVRSAGDGKQLIAGQKVGGERYGQRVRAAGDVRAHKSRFGVESVGIDALQIVTPLIVVTVTGRGGKMRGVHAVFLHGCDDLGLIDLSYGVDLRETVTQCFDDALAIGQHGVAHAETAVDFIGCHGYSRPFFVIQTYIIREGVLKVKKNVIQMLRGQFPHARVRI